MLPSLFIMASAIEFEDFEAVALGAFDGVEIQPGGVNEADDPLFAPTPESMGVARGFAGGRLDIVASGFRFGLREQICRGRRRAAMERLDPVDGSDGA